MKKNETPESNMETKPISRKIEKTLDELYERITSKESSKAADALFSASDKELGEHYIPTHPKNHKIKQ